ncbi:MAG: polysaccharide biosynthesis tyrosine autokinase [Muribaculaceae bacterium]|nr:polysaccharide biosynthesis tyrosine autokinase [Muribaculaceae bacterium]
MEDNKKQKGDAIDVAGMLRQYVSKWYIFAICIVVCVGLAFLYTQISNPKYMVKANVLVAQSDDPISDMAGGLGSLLTGSSGYVEDEVFVVSSHTVLREVVRRLELNRMHIVSNGLRKTFTYKDFPVDVYCDPSIPDTLRVGLRFKVKVDKEGKATIKAYQRRRVVGEVEDAEFPATVNTPYGKFIFNKTNYLPIGESVKTNIYFYSYDDAAENLARDLTIDIASRKSNVITLDIQSTDIPYAKDVLNAIIAEYNNRGIIDKNLRNTKTLEFIDSRLNLLSGDLSESEVSIENYKKSNGITDIIAETNYQITKKGKLEEELIATETKLKVIQIIRDFLADPKHKYDLVPASLNDPDNQGPLTAYNELLLKRIELIQNARQGNAGLTALDEQIDAMRNNVQSTIDRTYEGTYVQLKELQNEMNLADARLGGIPTQEREFRDILRQQQIKEQLYIFLLERREETSMLLANSQPKGQIVDEAYALNEPLGLSKSMILIAGFLVGIMLAIAIIYMRRVLRNKFDSREELEELTSIPILGEVCTSRRGEALVVREGGSTSSAELFRLIRTNLQFVLNGKDNKVILVTSTISGEGKSFISINLASSLALLGKRVLLVGVDIRNPKLVEYLNLPEGPGFTDYLANPDITIDDILRREPLMPNMDIITAGPVPPNPSELLTENRVDELMERLRGMYDYILLDSAPVGMVSDTFSLVRISDATVYVCRANYSTMREVKYVNRLYHEGRLKKLTLVINGTTARQGYGYGYGQKGTVS